jgi:hypothetical protein
VGPVTGVVVKLRVESDVVGIGVIDELELQL